MLGPNEYPWQAWNTGDTLTASDWQNMADSTKQADKKPMHSEMFRNYWYLRHTKEVHTGGSYTAVKDAKTTGSIDSTLGLLDNNSIKCTVNSTSFPFNNGFYHTFASNNMLTFMDGVSTDAYWVTALVGFYISDVTKFSNLKFRLGTDGSNYYQYSFSAGSLIDGYNLKGIDLTACSQVGSPSWTNITYIEAFQEITSNANGSYWAFDHMQIMRYTDEHNVYPLIQSNGDDSAWTADIPRFGYFFHMAVCSALPWPSPGMIRISSAVVPRVWDLDANTHRSFYCRTFMACKVAGKSMSLRWEVDDNNYIETYVDANTLYLKKCVAGSITTKSKSIGISLAKNANFGFTVWKEDTHFVIMMTNVSMNPCILECSHISTSEGTVCMGSPVAGAISFLYGWTVSHNPGASISQTVTYW
jgi:hypothetical protein